MITRFDIEKAYQYLLILLAFLIPLTVFGANLIIVIIVLLWILTGNYKLKFYQIFNNKLMVASIVFFAIHVIGLLWTEDKAWGLHIVHKMWYFLLLLPVLFTIVKKEYIKHYVYAFLFALLVTITLSYLIWFELIPPFKEANIFDPTPFMSHVSYNPILLFGIYLMYHETIFNKNLTKLKIFLYCFVSIAMTFNMFITLGRAGQVVFFLMVPIFIFQCFPRYKFKAILLSLIIVPSIFLSAYQASDFFKLRVDNTVVAVTTYNDNNFTSLGIRLTYAINSVELIKENLLFGVGTGDLPNELNKINMKNTPNMPSTTNPHNMYILVLVQLGLLGFISLLSILYYQIKLSFYGSNKFIRDFGITLPLLFFALMLSDSYLLGHFTSLMFVFFSSFLYKNFEIQ